jgi:hypothetical protein
MVAGAVFGHHSLAVAEAQAVSTLAGTNPNQ